MKTKILVALLAFGGGACSEWDPDDIVCDDRLEVVWHEQDRDVDGLCTLLDESSAALNVRLCEDVCRVEFVAHPRLVEGCEHPELGDVKGCRSEGILYVKYAPTVVETKVVHEWLHETLADQTGEADGEHDHWLWENMEGWEECSRKWQEAPRSWQFCKRQYIRW